MPLSNVANSVDWGYLPIGYFGVGVPIGNLIRLAREAESRNASVL